jgi:hypothetical protein
MKIVVTPDWFLTNDVGIEIFSFAILFLFFLLAYMSYRMSKNKNVFYLGIGFLLISIAELSSILTKVVLYYNTTFTHQVGQMIITTQIVRSVDIFYYLGFFFYQFLTLAGLYVIYRISNNRRLGEDLLLLLYFILLSAIISTSLGLQWVFHLTVIILLIIIIRSYVELCKKNKHTNTVLLVAAFSLITLSHVMLMMSDIPGLGGEGMLYVIAQFEQLVSYIILLFLIVRILKHGRQEKKPGRYSI